MLSLRVGATWGATGPVDGTGRWLHGLIPFGGLSFSTAFQRPTGNTGGGGMLVVSWDMATPANLPLPTQVRQDSLVEVFAGSWPLGMATIAETPRGNAVTADGLFRLGEYFKAVDSSFKATTDVSIAVAQAITRGLRWLDPGTLPTGSLSTLSEDTAQVNTISGLLNAYCRVNGKFWYIDRFGYLRIVDPPATTSPDWVLSPLLPIPQTADDDYVSRWFIRRVDGVDTDGQPNAFDTETAVDAAAPAIREEFADLEQLGYLGPSAGVAVAQAYLDANKARSGFVEGVQYAAGQLTTPGGVAPEPWAVAAGEVVQHPNWLSASGDLTLGRSQAWVIGGTQWRQGEAPVITPLGLAPRTVAQITAAQGARRGRLVFV